MPLSPLILLPMAIAAAGATGQAVASKDSMSFVQCAAGRHFRFAMDSDRALIDVDGRRFSLPRRELPIGQYFRSEDGALVIDGDFVAFVPRGDENWRDCHLDPVR